MVLVDLLVRLLGGQAHNLDRLFLADSMDVRIRFAFSGPVGRGLDVQCVGAAVMNVVSGDV